MCLRGELWIHGWPNLGNAQVLLVLAALVCTNGGPTVTDQSSSGILIQIETQRILKLRRKCQFMRKNMPYAHFAEICKNVAIIYSHKTDMPTHVFWKSVKFWQTYRHQLVIHFFGTHCRSKSQIRCFSAFTGSAELGAQLTYLLTTFGIFVPVSLLEQYWKRCVLRFSVHVSVCVPWSLWTTWYLINHLGESHHIYNFSGFGD